MKFDRDILTKDQLLLYAVTDSHWLNGRTLHSVVKESLEGGVTFVQLREKQLDEAHFMEEAKDLQVLCREYNVPFIINDNVDIALAMDADGVHVGQSDMEAGDVRAKLGPDKIIGVSAQTVEQAILAEKHGADYLGVGAVFPTGSKDDATEVPHKTLKAICEAVSIPVMAKCRIGHFVEAQILEAIEIDYIDESEVLSPADDIYHINKKEFKVPFVCGARDLGEALRRIAEGASMIRTKGEPGTGDVVQAVRHMRAMNAEIRRIQNLRADELFEAAKQLQVPVDLVEYVHENGKLPVVNFAAGGVATPADAALMMQLGAEGVFVGSGIFKSGNPAKRAASIVKAVTNYTDAKLIAELSTDLGEAMVGINEQEIELLMAERGK